MAPTAGTAAHGSHRSLGRNGSVHSLVQYFHPLATLEKPYTLWKLHVDVTGHLPCHTPKEGNFHLQQHTRNLCEVKTARPTQKDKISMFSKPAIFMGAELNAVPAINYLGIKSASTPHSGQIAAPGANSPRKKCLILIFASSFRVHPCISPIPNLK